MKSSKKSDRRRRTASRSYYDLTRSPFYRLERRTDLAKLLNLSDSKMKELVETRAELYDVREDDTSGKTRTLQVPQRAMRRCHDRLLHLLRRIRLPGYIRSPRKRSSAWQNAEIHASGKFVTSFDLKRFYPSTTEEHIFRLFKYRFEMSDDCSRVLAQIATYDGFLPQGSPSSPHLACLAHLDMFEDAAVLAVDAANTLSVWVDDIVISGPAPRRDIVESIKNRARDKGLKTHKDQRGGGKKGIELTGSFLRNGKIAVANSSHIKIRDLTRELQATTDPHDRYGLFNRLAAMTRHQRTVIKSSGGDIQKLNARLSYYKREMQKLNSSLSTTLPQIAADLLHKDCDGDPF